MRAEMRLPFHVAVISSSPRQFHRPSFADAAEARQRAFSSHIVAARRSSFFAATVPVDASSPARRCACAAITCCASYHAQRRSIRVILPLLFQQFARHRGIPAIRRFQVSFAAFLPGFPGFRHFFSPFTGFDVFLSDCRRFPQRPRRLIAWSPFFHGFHAALHAFVMFVPRCSRRSYQIDRQHDFSAITSVTFSIFHRRFIDFTCASPLAQRRRRR